ncbi:MAG: hypothetical protein IKS37_09960 [Solobacterium sp.]|nr:hypothetical protein [Solobacterium sp.]
MKQYFSASLCEEGILGGAIIADDIGITYRTNKITIPDRLKKIEMHYEDIAVMVQKYVLCFPAVTITLRNGEMHTFIVFRRRTFCELLHRMCRF